MLVPGCRCARVKWCSAMRLHITQSMSDVVHNVCCAKIGFGASAGVDHQVRLER